MNKEIKICPAMVRCGESPRNALDGVRTPVAGFLFTPKTSSYDKRKIEFAPSV